MGIDIFAEWNGQSSAEKSSQTASWLSAIAGNAGYLREAYHGGPYPTMFLCGEAFETGSARITAAVLRERLPETLALVETRERRLYRSDIRAIERVKQSYREFVELCERKERETGEPVRIVASY